MSGNLTVALQSARSGLLTTQAAVGAAANNIANANTEGYSRKIANFENRVLNGSGAGVQLSDFTRAIDEGLLSDLRDQLSATNELSSQEPYFQRIQNLFGTPGDNTSISHIINELTQATEALAANPSETLEQSDFVRYANDLALTMKNMSSQIQDLRLQADAQITSSIDEINSLTQIIATSNDQIIRNEAVSNDITSLLDQRDNALTRLSELINITTYPRSDGD